MANLKELTTKELTKNIMQDFSTSGSYFNGGTFFRCKYPENKNYDISILKTSLHDTSFPIQNIGEHILEDQWFTAAQISETKIAQVPNSNVVTLKHRHFKMVLVKANFEGRTLHNIGVFQQKFH